MKRIVLVFTIILSLCLFTACGNVSNNSSISDNKIMLTTENAEDYLSIELRGFGNPFTKYSYDKLCISGSISGVSGCFYNNVSITISTTFQFEDNRMYKHSEKHTQVVTFTSDLNLGGTSNVNVREPIMVEGEQLYPDGVTCLGYEIISITGYIEKQ